MRILAAALLLASASMLTHAGERELASKGDIVKLTIDDSYVCSSTANIKITTSSADYFDQDAEVIQKLANVARVVLGFECPNISRLEFAGITDKVYVFHAEAKKSNKWAIETYPAPLEGLALLFSRYKPEFFHLGTINNKLKHFKNVTGIKNTYQFKAYEKQARRLAGIADGDINQFQTYLKNSGHKFKKFAQMEAHFVDILKTIEAYAPKHFLAYKKSHIDVSSKLKSDYWSARVASVLNNEENIAAIIAGAVSLVKDDPSNEFKDFVDISVASWIKEDADFIKSDLLDAPLFEIAYASDYLASFPDASSAKNLTQTKLQLQSLPAEILPLVEQRIEILYSLAVDIIQETGTSYADVETTLETGFALAGEFESAGYVDDGEALIAATVIHIENILKSGIGEYKEKLKDIEFNGETAAALQEQAILFEELSAEFDGFVAYKAAAEEALNANKRVICEGILKEAGVKPKYFGIPVNIRIGKEKHPLIELSCDLYENSHVVSKFSETDGLGNFSFNIDEANGTNSRFILETELSLSGLVLHPILRDDNTPVSETEWQAYIASLLEPPPSGKPDKNGVRECDRLAADPYDAKKLATGIDFEKDDIEPDIFDRGIDTCIAAVEHSPDDVRQLFQLGRILWYAGDQESAIEYLDIASKSGYAAAKYYKAQALLVTSDDQNAFIDALELFEASGKSGYKRGSQMVKELNPDGIEFFKEIPAPTDAEIAGTFSNAGGTHSGLGVSVTIKVVDAAIKECFQTSATDFSCEYRTILACDVKGDSKGIMAIMNWAVQSDCNDRTYTFDSFRKLANGEWRKLPSAF